LAGVDQKTDDNRHILQILYVPTTTATYLQDVVNQISKYNLQRTAVRNRLNKLEALGLIKMTRSSLTCVNSIPALEGRVKRLIMCCKLKFEW
jgi:DNA-binding Lrp family transcriptional regulator